MLYSFFVFLMLHVDPEPFEGILIYRTDYPRHTNISTYYIMPGHIGIDSKSYESDSIYSVRYHYDMTTLCRKCYTLKVGSTEKEFVEREPKEWIHDYEVVDSSEGGRLIAVHYNQDMIGFDANELYETRIEDTNLIVDIPEGFKIAVPPVTHHSKFIATKITKTQVLDTGTYRKETEIITELIAKIPMKLSEQYFKID